VRIHDKSIATSLKDKSAEGYTNQVSVNYYSKRSHSVYGGGGRKKRPPLYQKSPTTRNIFEPVMDNSGLP
jgi:hypothetical protein